jgi:hypothetical protein
MDILIGSSVTLQLRFERNGEPVIPTNGTVFYTVRGHDGSPISGLVDVPVTTGPTDTIASITIDAMHNGATRRIEKRFVTYRYVVQGWPLERTINYRLIPFLNITVTKDQVRSALGGIGQVELRDDEIDIVRAYLQIETSVTADLLSAVLDLGDDAEMQANEAILWQAALNVIPAVKLRVMQKETDGPISFQRGDITKLLEQLEADLRSKLLASINLVSGRTISSYPLIIFALPTDVITGA